MLFTSPFFSILQHHLKHLADPLIRCNAQRYPVELPKLNVVVHSPKITYPVSSLPALTITHRGSLPSITSKKCHSRLVNGILSTRKHTMWGSADSVF